jgi:hypothetical protein
MRSSGRKTPGSGSISLSVPVDGCALLDCDSGFWFIVSEFDSIRAAYLPDLRNLRFLSECPIASIPICPHLRQSLVVLLLTVSVGFRTGRGPAEEVAPIVPYRLGLQSGRGSAAGPRPPPSYPKPDIEPRDGVDFGVDDLFQLLEVVW